MHTHVPIINLIDIELHESLNKHVNIVYWQNCANNVSLNIMTYFLFYFFAPKFNVLYEECSTLTFNFAQCNQLHDTISNWEYAFVM